MRKLVLGIIALISVQFAFVTYMMVLQPPMGLTQHPGQTETGRDNPDPVRIDAPSGSTKVVLEPAVVVPQIEPRHTRARRPVAGSPEVPDERLEGPVVNGPTIPRFNSAAPKTTEPVEFERVLILYDRNADDTSPDANAPDCETQKIPKARKRSLIAKAAPVIKKPWEFIKAVGSKLN